MHEGRVLHVFMLGTTDGGGDLERCAILSSIVSGARAQVQGRLAAEVVSVLPSERRVRCSALAIENLSEKFNIS